MDNSLGDIQSGTAHNVSICGGASNDLFLQWVQGEGTDSVGTEGSIGLPPTVSALCGADSGEGGGVTAGGRRCLVEGDDVNAFAPTKETACYWLQCDGPGGYGPPDLTNQWMLRRLRCRCVGKTQLDLDHNEMRDVAIRCRTTSGKWILKVPYYRVDVLWGMVAENVQSGTLGQRVRLKCSSRALVEGGVSRLYTLCVYTPGGWINRDEVMHVRQALHDIGADKECAVPLYWKPDLYTMLPLKGPTSVWKDGLDTGFWFDHWDNNKKEDVHNLEGGPKRSFIISSS